MEEKPEELEPLFVYKPTTSFILLDDDGSDCEHVFKLSPKRRKKVVPDECESDEKKVEVKNSVIELDETEEDWLLPPPPPRVVSKTKVEQENSTIKQLRLKRQELASFALSAGEVLEAVEESAKKELSSSVTNAETEPKVRDERAKVIISIQDKDGAKQFRVYMDEKFEKFFKQYADKEKHEIQSLVFCFDGDKINPATTPASLGMEDDDIIEVHTVSQADQGRKKKS